MALARLVLPTPGTSSMRRWPSASMQISASSMASVLPWTDREMFVVMTSNRSGKVGAVRSTTVTTTKGRWAGARPRGRQGPSASRHPTVGPRGDLPRDRHRRDQAGRRRGGRRRPCAGPDRTADRPRPTPGRVWPALVTATLEGAAARRPVAVGVGCGGPMTAGGELVSPLNIPGWRDFPLRGAAGGADRPAGGGRQRREGAGPRRGLVRRGPGRARTSWPWSSARASAAASCSTAGCSTAPTATPGTWATSSSSPTVAGARAGAAAASRPRRPVSPSRRSPGRPPADAPLDGAGADGPARRSRGGRRLRAAGPRPRRRRGLGGARLRRGLLHGGPGASSTVGPASASPAAPASSPPASAPTDR